MRHVSNSLLGSMCLAACQFAAPGIWAADGPSVVYLDTVATTDPGDDKLDGGLLLRELARQAVLIAAREELGLGTRDATLGEFVRDDAPERSPHIKTRAVIGRGFRIWLEQDGPAGRSTVWDREIPLADKDIDYLALTTELEKLSRTEMVTALLKAGFKKDADRPGRGDAAVPEAVGKQLEELGFVGPVTALRTLHQLARTQGESDAVLGGLVRGYGVLGQLTWAHWTASSVGAIRPGPVP